MPNGPNKKHRGLRNVLQKAPGGEFLLALWDWEGGIMGKVLIAVIFLGGLLLYLHFSRQPSSNVANTVIATNNSNSPATQIIKSPGAVVNNNSGNTTTSIINYNYYVEPDSEQGKKLVKKIITASASSLDELNSIFPYGFTTIAGKAGPMPKAGTFTTVANEKSSIKLNGNITIEVNREEKMIHLRFGILPMQQAKGEGQFVQGVFLLSMSLTNTEIQTAPMPVNHVEICGKILDGNPDAPMVAIGFRPPDKPDMMDEVLKIINAHNASNDVARHTN